jgi:hypothetical protein
MNPPSLELASVCQKTTSLVWLSLHRMLTSSFATSRVVALPVVKSPLGTSFSIVGSTLVPLSETGVSKDQYSCNRCHDIIKVSCSYG